LAIKLEVEHLTKRYPPPRRGAVGFKDLVDTIRGRREEVVALDDVSFKVKSGEWFGLLGPNGAGKTTFCDILLDITTPTSGRILFDGRDVNRQHSYTKGRICTMAFWVFRNRIRMRDALTLAGKLWMLEREEIERKIEWLAELFGVTDKLDEWSLRLSRGTAVKMLIIATVMPDAELYVFDEPTPMLDILTRKKLYSQLKEFQHKTGATILCTTHNLQEAQETRDRIAVINNRLITAPTPGRLMAEMKKTSLEEAFIELLRNEVQGSKPRTEPSQ